MGLGGRVKGNSLFIDALFWILCTGTPWQNLPPDYGGWKNAHRRFTVVVIMAYRNMYLQS
ncbi:transposase [uncultured Bilophila sp.]|uniref:transposase n=1 Tax=uncultured Bilophila sp. TaxID=529385 RepID=UPI0035A57CEE